MPKFWVSIDHRLIGGTQVFSTSTRIEAPGFTEALAGAADGLRAGHEIVSVMVNLEEDDEPKGGE
jgi:hypothetical protein